MFSDIRVVLPNRPGSLSKALDVLAESGIELEGFCGDIRPGEAWGYVHVLVENPETARSGLEAAGFEVTSIHDVDVKEVEPKLGAIAELVHAYSEAGHNIEVLYMAGRSRVVIGTEDMQKERYGVRMGDAKS